MSMSRLEAVCREQDAKWLHRLSLGIDDEEVGSTLPLAALSLTGSCRGPAGLCMSPAHQLGPAGPKEEGLHEHSVLFRLHAHDAFQTLLHGPAGQ